MLTIHERFDLTVAIVSHGANGTTPSPKMLSTVETFSRIAPSLAAGLHAALPLEVPDSEYLRQNLSNLSESLPRGGFVELEATAMIAAALEVARLDTADPEQRDCFALDAHRSAHWLVRRNVRSRLPTFAETKAAVMLYKIRGHESMDGIDARDIDFFAAHLLEIAPLLNELKERRTFDRGTIEMLLASEASLPLREGEL